MAAIVNGNTITLTGVVGPDFYDEWFSHADVVRALAYFADDEDLTIRINSPGGAADEGIAIYNALRVRSGSIHAIIDGLAASAATIIALGADRVTMSPGSLFMIHEAGVSMLAANSLDIEEARRTQAAFTNSLVEIYRKKTGKSDRDIRAYLSPETWFSAEEAKAAGFVDELTSDAIDIIERAPAFPYQTYAKAPQRLVALAMSRQWDRPAQATTTPDRKEQAMSDKTPGASAHATATARIKAIMQDPEAKGRNELAEHLAFDTALDAEAAVAILKKAPAAGEEDDPIAAYEARRFGTAHAGPRLNGEGLNVNGAGLGGHYRDGRSDGGIVAAMKKRHGAK